jgi:hypothetical protein
MRNHFPQRIPNPDGILRKKYKLLNFRLKKIIFLKRLTNCGGNVSRSPLRFLESVLKMSSDPNC